MTSLGLYCKYLGIKFYQSLHDFFLYQIEYPCKIVIEYAINNANLSKILLSINLQLCRDIDTSHIDPI